MPVVEVIVGAAVGLGGAILGSYAAHRYEEYRQTEDQRLRTNNVLFAIMTELRVVGERYQSKIRDVLQISKEGEPIRVVFQEGISGISSYRENVCLITSEIAEQSLVRDIIELDQLWKGLSGEFAVNNWYLARLQSQQGNDAIITTGHLIRHAPTVRCAYNQFETKAADVICQIEKHLAKSTAARFYLFPTDWDRR